LGTLVALEPTPKIVEEEVLGTDERFLFILSLLPV